MSNDEKSEKDDLTLAVQQSLSSEETGKLEAGLGNSMPRRATAPSADYVLQRPRRTPNNPQGEPTGHYTGRCGNCSSRNLWDDETAYGCRDCKAIYYFRQ